MSTRWAVCSGGSEPAACRRYTVDDETRFQRDADADVADGAAERSPGIDDFPRRDELDSALAEVGENSLDHRAEQAMRTNGRTMTTSILLRRAADRSGSGPGRLAHKPPILRVRCWIPGNHGARPAGADRRAFRVRINRGNPPIEGSALGQRRPFFLDDRPFLPTYSWMNRNSTSVIFSPLAAVAALKASCKLT